MAFLAELNTYRNAELAFSLVDKILNSNFVFKFRSFSKLHILLDYMICV